MNNEIKEILKDYKKLAGEITLKIDNTAEYESWLIIQDYFDYLLDYITNLQQIEKDHQKLNGELREENEKLKEKCDYLERSNNRREDEIMSLRDECVDGETYKSRNEKTIDNIDITIKLIKQQPTDDDTWILNRLNGFKYLLQGSDNDD